MNPIVLAFCQYDDMHHLSTRANPVPAPLGHGKAKFILRSGSLAAFQLFSKEVLPPASKLQKHNTLHYHQNIVFISKLFSGFISLLCSLKFD